MFCQRSCLLLLKKINIVQLFLWLHVHEDPGNLIVHKIGSKVNWRHFFCPFFHKCCTIILRRNMMPYDNLIHASRSSFLLPNLLHKELKHQTFQNVVSTHPNEASSMKGLALILNVTPLAFTVNWTGYWQWSSKYESLPRIGADTNQHYIITDFCFSCFLLNFLFKIRIV